MNTGGCAHTRTPSETRSAHPMISTSTGTSMPTISHFENTSYRFEPKMYGVADEKNGFGTSEMIFSVYSAMPKCQNFSRPYRGRDFLTAHCVCGGCALSAHPPTWVCAGLGRDPPPPHHLGGPQISEYRSSAHTHPYASDVLHKRLI